MSCYCCSSKASFRCKNCQTAKYCSKICQKADWDTHKHECYAKRGAEEDDEGKPAKKQRLDDEEMRQKVVEMYAQIQQIELYSKNLTPMRQRLEIWERRLDQLQEDGDSEEIEHDDEEEQELIEKIGQMEIKVKLQQTLLDQARATFAAALKEIPAQSSRKFFNMARPGTTTTLLTRAIYTKIPALVTMILNTGNVYISEEDLLLAVELNATRILRALLDKSVLNSNVIEPLLKALKTRKTELAKLLLKKGAMLDGNPFITELEEFFVADEKEMFELTVAAYSEHYLGLFLTKIIPTKNVALVRLLIEKNADVNAEFKGKTALEQASDTTSNVEMVSLLLQKGASVEKESVQQSVLRFAATNDSVDLLHTLIEKQVDIAQKVWGKSILFPAVARNSFDVVKFLVEEKGFDVNERDEDGDTPIVIASSRGNYGIVKILIDKGARLNIHGEESALHAAVRSNEEEVSELLLENGADVDERDDEGDTPLMTAVFNTNLDIVRLLLSGFAKVNLRDAAGRTALGLFLEITSLPYSFDEEEIRDLLLDEGAKE